MWLGPELQLSHHPFSKRKYAVFGTPCSLYINYLQFYTVSFPYVCHQLLGHRFMIQLTDPLAFLQSHITMVVVGL